jgi:hypothetical protein
VRRLPAFGDAFELRVALREIEPAIWRLVRCTGGARACPPEDSGGPHGYAELLEVLGNPASEEHTDMKAWVGPRFDPERFDIAAVNKKLATLSRRFGRQRKK